jgi:plastocyanin
MNTHIAATLALLAACAANATAAEEHVVSQKNKSFSQKTVKVKIGDSIKFVNDDAFAHNVFSLSDTKSFDLGTYSKGGTKSVTFDKAGTVEVECAIHPDMKMTVEVSK